MPPLKSLARLHQQVERHEHWALRRFLATLDAVTQDCDAELERRWCNAARHVNALARIRQRMVEGE